MFCCAVLCVCECVCVCVCVFVFGYGRVCAGMGVCVPSRYAASSECERDACAVASARKDFVTASTDVA